MAKSDLIHKADLKFAAQMLLFKNNLPKYAAILEVTPAQVAAQAAEADYYDYIVTSHGELQSQTKRWTALKRGLRTGRGPVDAPTPPSLVLTDPLPPVTWGVERRFRALVRRIKLHANYNLIIGTELGIEAVDHAAPDFSALHPKLTAVVVGSEVLLGWDWQGRRAFLDLCEIQVDRSDGRSFGPLTHSTLTRAMDKTPFPATPTRWSYRAIYHAKGAQTGQWSGVVSVMVPP